MNRVQSWINEIDPEELPEPYKTIAEEIGIKGALVLADMYQGTYTYLPKLDDVLVHTRNRKIKKEFNGYNYKELALKYKLSENWIRKIVKESSN